MKQEDISKLFFAIGIIIDTANKAFDVTERNLVATNLTKRNSEDLM